ncbi:PREDICTED: uncharacterized protein LOC105543848 [Mandrillus leucophaeus]|uniref:uncharacterized protein LOC105543848 n=1 Tax=Mandrillus leucophaeus TaxID=9568 RepID=UPI0005F374D3|nr:PREDICTED: uncharacterized protein LOC105543848 [Mandrillus leucophaeus]
MSLARFSFPPNPGPPGGGVKRGHGLGCGPLFLPEHWPESASSWHTQPGPQAQLFLGAPEGGGSAGAVACNVWTQPQSGRKFCRALSAGASLVILLNRKPGSAGVARSRRERGTPSPRAPAGASGGEAGERTPRGSGKEPRPGPLLIQPETLSSSGRPCAGNPARSFSRPGRAASGKALLRFRAASPASPLETPPRAMVGA